MPLRAGFVFFGAPSIVTDTIEGFFYTQITPDYKAICVLLLGAAQSTQVTAQSIDHNHHNLPDTALTTSSLTK